MDEKVKKVALWLGLICTALGLIIFIVWIAGVRENKQHLKICSEVVEGFVARYERAKQKHPFGDNEAYRYNVTEFSAVYQYVVDDTTYESLSEFSSKKEYVKVNARVAIHYNPQNPQECFVPADPYNKSTGFIVFSSLLLTMGVASFVKVYRSKNSRNSTDFHKSFF